MVDETKRRGLVKEEGAPKSRFEPSFRDTYLDGARRPPATVDVRPAWTRPELALRYVEAYLHRHRRDSWNRLSALKKAERVGTAEVHSRQSILELLGTTLAIRSLQARLEALEKLQQLGIVHHVSRDAYHLFPDRMWWLRMFEGNRLLAELSGIEDLDLVQLARHTAHEMAKQQGVSTGLPPRPERGFKAVDDLAGGAQSFHAALGFNKNPAIRAAYELVQWTHLLYLWDLHRKAKEYNGWARDALRALFKEQGWRTSNPAIQQVTSLGVQLGVLEIAYHGRLPVGWHVRPWMIPVADGFLNHVLDNPSIRQFVDAMSAAQEFADDLARTYGTPAERATNPQWESIRKDWLNAATDLYD